MQTLHRLHAALYQWLPRLMGCHCRPERSFHFRGRPFPVCARCTGELLGAAAGLSTGILCRPPVPVLVLLLLPMLADGTAQLLLAYTSCNRRRLITGALFGYAGVCLLIALAAAAFRLGYDLGKTLG